MGLSRTTRLNWILDAGVFLSALVAGISALYFLYVPVGGYQGGRIHHMALRSCSVAAPGMTFICGVGLR